MSRAPLASAPSSWTRFDPPADNWKLSSAVPRQYFAPTVHATKDECQTSPTVTLCAPFFPVTKQRGANQPQQPAESGLMLQVEDGEEAGKALDTGDQVEFSVLLNRKLGTSIAEGVKLLCKAEDKRELGQVSHKSYSVSCQGKT